MRESAASGGSRGEKTGCSFGLKKIHNAQTRKSKPALVSKTARAQSSTPPCAATANTASAQMPKRNNLMVWDAPQAPEPRRRHPPRPFLESCCRLPHWENGANKPAILERPFLRTKATGQVSKE